MLMKQWELINIVASVSKHTVRGLEMLIMALQLLKYK